MSNKSFIFPILLLIVLQQRILAQIFYIRVICRFKFREFDVLLDDIARILIGIQPGLV